MEFLEYPHIDSIFKRDAKGQFIDEYSRPEFAYLANNKWVFTEKIDGINIRIGWDGKNIKIAGRTDKAQIPAFLLEALQTTFTPERFGGFTEIVLYGEGYGAKIQKGGKYRSTPGFILFDVYIGMWLKREDVEDIAYNFCLDVVPIIAWGSLDDAIQKVRMRQNKSIFGDFEAEGLVIKPAIELSDRRSHRIITKLKYKDFGF